MIASASILDFTDEIRGDSFLKETASASTMDITDEIRDYSILIETASSSLMAITDDIMGDSFLIETASASTMDITDDIMGDSFLIETASASTMDITDEIKSLIYNLKHLSFLFSKDALDQSLLSSCWYGHMHLIPFIIEAGADLETTDSNGFTPLALCILNSQECCAKLLVSKGANVEATDPNLNTPLILCALNRETGCARILLEAGADVNAVNIYGNTPLIVSSCFSSSIKVTTLLIHSRDINVEHNNNEGCSALLCAVEVVNLNAVKLLIDAGALANEDTHSEQNKKLNLSLKNIAVRKGISNLVKIFKKEKCSGQSSMLLAALKRDLESLQLLSCMNRKILNTTRESSLNNLTLFLQFLNQNNHSVSGTDIDLLQILLNTTLQSSPTSDEKEKVMQLAVSIGNIEIIELLAKNQCNISNEALKSTCNNLDLLKFLLKMFHSINKVDSSQKPVYEGSALEKAMHSERIANASLLIHCGAYLDVEQALKYAVNKGNEMSLQFLLTEYNAKSLECINSSDLLHIAVKNSLISIIKMLLDHGADINQIQYGKSPLTAAVDIEVIELLLSRGADVNLKIGVYETYPILEFVSLDFTKALSRKWSALNPFFSNGLESYQKRTTEEIIQLLISYGASTEVSNYRGQTALHIAAEIRNSSEIIKMLIAHGSNVNKTDCCGETALFPAVQDGCLENIKILIEAGSDVNFVCDDRKETALFRSLNCTVLSLLIQSGADVNFHDREGNTALLHALQSGELEVFQVLVEAGCNLNHTNNRGVSALILAAKLVNLELLKYLITSGADVRESNHKNITVLSVLLVKLWNHLDQAMECIEFLVDYSIPIVNVHSCVAHVLISSGCLSLIPRFISTGLAPAYLSISNNVYAWYKSTTYISPLALALTMNHSDLAQYLIQIRFLMRSDISILSGNETIHEHIECEGNKRSLELLKTFCCQPLSLETLCFIVVSDVLGPSHDRKLKVKKIGLPMQLQDMLLFKHALDFESPLDNAANKRNLSVFKYSLQQMQLLESDDEDDETTSDFYSSDEDEYWMYL
ncbi:ankyrin repeat protein [Biomphalaria glabrata]|nr:ankyrin repeat protein [Biomphalaria glabrata]